LYVRCLKRMRHQPDVVVLPRGFASASSTLNVSDALVAPKALEGRNGRSSLLVGAEKLEVPTEVFPTGAGRLGPTLGP